MQIFLYSAKFDTKIILKEHSLPYYLTGRKTVWFIPFSRVLALCDM